MSKQNAYIHGGGGIDFFYSIYWVDSMIKENGQYLCITMGYEEEFFDEFVEAHKPCLN